MITNFTVPKKKIKLVNRMIILLFGCYDDVVPAPELKIDFSGQAIKLQISTAPAFYILIFRTGFDN